MSGKKKKYTIGIDVGGTKILVAVLDGAFRIQSEVKMKTRPEKGLSRFVVDLHDCVRQVIAEARIKRCGNRRRRDRMPGNDRRGTR